MHENSVIIRAGVPSANKNFYHRLRFLAGDPGAIIDFPVSGGKRKSVLIIRNIEVDRARQHARADEVYAPQDFVEPKDLPADHELAAAAGLASYLSRQKITAVVADRSLPLVFAEYLKRASISVTCDETLGVMERRAKDNQEIQFLKQAQHDTEQCVQYACEIVARATADKNGILQHDHAPLTSERLQTLVDVFLLQRGYSNPGSILACGPSGSDCHFHGAGLIYTQQPVIIDIYPLNKSTLYNGDCTRTVVHGDIPDIVKKMHADVVAAKAAATAVVKPGATGDAVHQATKSTLIARSNHIGFAPPDRKQCFIPHGTGHGVGLEVHEPPLLTDRGAPLIEGDALTIEPALYNLDVGGVRVEDMVVVTKDGCINLNKIQEGLCWK